MAEFRRAWVSPGRTPVVGLAPDAGLESTLLGIALGLAGALGISRLLKQALFEVDPAEPVRRVIDAGRRPRAVDTRHGRF